MQTKNATMDSKLTLKYALIVLLSQVLCLAIGVDSRKGFFTNLDADAVKEDSIKSVLLKTLSVPSELSCSQKCFADDQCAYKLFYPTSNKCELYKSVSPAIGSIKAVKSKKVQVREDLSRYIINSWFPCDCW